MAVAHHVAIRELDLRACHPASMVDRVSAVPALRTSAAFFTFLRANLVLHSAMSSASGTPQLGPATSLGALMAPSPSLSPSASASASPSPLAASSVTISSSGSDLYASPPPAFALDDSDVPPLDLEVLNARQDKVDGLRLIADSIAQMRQRASKALIFHPICVAGFLAALAAVYSIAGVSHLDLGLSLTLTCGAIMSYLAGIRYFTGGYVALAERMGWKWLRSDHGCEDRIIAARFNGEIVASLVLRLEPNPAFGGRRKSRSVTLRGGKGVIRAWTTQLKYRGQGIGRDLLYEAVRITKERCGRDAQVGFAKEHANSAMVLPEMFNVTFRQDEIRATKALDGVLADWEVAKKKR